MLEEEFEDREEMVNIVEGSGVGAWVVGHEEVEEDEDEVLNAERKPL